ncbi:MAG TPA: hypothetical protein VIJ57_06885 [Hanamia sp.]
MKTLFILFAGFLLFTAFAFIPPKHHIVGHWVEHKPDGSKVYIDFKGDGTFASRYKGKVDMYGNYTFADPVFSITDKENGGCGNGYWGKYNVTFIGKDSVSFAVIEDSCTGRREDVNGSGLRREMK